MALPNSYSRITRNQQSSETQQEAIFTRKKKGASIDEKPHPYTTTEPSRSTTRGKYANMKTG